MPTSVFQAANYKDFLREKVAGSGLRSGYQTRLAQAAGCQKSFLSQVLKSHVHMTSDHAAGLCTFWHFSDDETTYFLDLVALERSASAPLRRFLEARLAALRERQTQIQDRYKSALKLPPADLVDYYASWVLAAIHVLVSIPEYGSPARLAARLALPEARIHASLAHLARMGLVHETADGWRALQHDLFLANGSPLARVHHAIWRQRAVLDLETGDAESLHFSSLYAISRADVGRFRELLVAFVAELRRLTAASPEEEMICVACDLFRV